MNSKSDYKVTKATKSGKLIAVLALLFAAVAIGIGILLVMTIPTRFALPQSRDIFTIDEPHNMTVLVVFNEEPPVVEFIAPDGNAIDMANLRQKPGSNYTQYFIPNAMPGIWRMAYDPLSNTEITTPYSVYMEHIFIRNFEVEVDSDENDGLVIYFEVSADENGKFDYEIHAVFTADDNSVEDEILLTNGNGDLNEPIDLALESEDISKRSGFMLRLTASVQYGQASVNDTAWLDLRLTAE